MNIIIKVVPHKEQRYETPGDWFYDASNNLQVRVSSLSNSRYEQLIAIHEVVEAILCDEAGVDEGEITKFDKEFESIRRPLDFSEPGDQPLAPYKLQHSAASGIERTLATHLGVDWLSYEDAVNNLLMQSWKE